VVNLERTMTGAVAGAVAAAVWAAEQPFDKRLFRSDYDDVELLGKLVTRGSDWPLAGFALHVQNGALFGAVYAHAKPFLPGPPLARAVIAGMAENFAFWPLGRLVDRYHPARDELEPFQGNRRALAQSTWRHLIFALVLGALEARLSERLDQEPPPIPASSNGHGNLEAAVTAA
jgi:hypothetical protein